MEAHKILEDIRDLKKSPRSEAKAKANSLEDVVKGFDPFGLIVQLHKNGKIAAKKALVNELKKQNDLGGDAVIQFSNSSIINQGTKFSVPESKKIVIGIYILANKEKTKLRRLFTGGLSKVFKEIGYIGMQAYVKAFAGDTWAKKVTKDNIYNGIGEGNHAGRIAYFFTLELADN